MVMPATQLTVQAIADSIGVKISDPSLISAVERLGETFVRDFLQYAVTFYHSTRSYRLTSAHLEMALESLTFAPLQGYQTPPSFSVQPLAIESCDLYAVHELPRPLSSFLAQPTPAPPQSTTHRLQWTLVEGLFCGRFFPIRRREFLRAPRPLERSISSPFVAQPPPELPRAATSEDGFCGDPVIKTADDTLSVDLQQFFLESINLLRDDVAHSDEASLELIASERKLQPLVPHFLQWLFGRIVIGLNNCEEMRAAMRLALALANNKWIAIAFYVHAFLKIGITGLLCTQAAPDDREVRAIAARLLKVVTDRCEDAFPGMRLAVGNACLDSLMNPRTSLGAHYGALLGIAELKVEVGRRHLAAYGAAVEVELGSSDPIQCVWAARVLTLLEMPEFA
jgi:hypothetical protein